MDDESGDWWVDGTNGVSATVKTGWVRIGEISAWLTKRSRELTEWQLFILKERFQFHVILSLLT